MGHDVPPWNSQPPALQPTAATDCSLWRGLPPHLQPQKHVAIRHVHHFHVSAISHQVWAHLHAVGLSVYKCAEAPVGLVRARLMLPQLVLNMSVPRMCPAQRTPAHPGGDAAHGCAYCVIKRGEPD